MRGGETSTTPTFQLGSTGSTPGRNTMIKHLRMCISEMCSLKAPSFAFMYKNVCIKKVKKPLNSSNSRIDNI